MFFVILTCLVFFMQARGQTQWGPKGGGPEGWGPEGWGPEGWGPEGWSPEGWSPEGWSPEGWSPEGWSPEGWSPEGWGPEPRKSGGPKGGSPKGGAQKGGAQKGGAPKGGAPQLWGPEAWEPKISRFFFSLSPPQNSFFSSLSGGLLVEFLVVFEAPGRSNVRVWSSLVVVCEPRRPGLVGPPGFHTTAREPKRAHLSVPALQTPPKFNEKTPREGRKERILRREREKKERNFGRSRGRAVQGKGGPGEGRSRGRAVQGKGGPGEGRSRGRSGPGKDCPKKGGPNQTLKPRPTHETPL